MSFGIRERARFQQKLININFVENSASLKPVEVTVESRLGGSLSRMIPSGLRVSVLSF